MGASLAAGVLEIQNLAAALALKKLHARPVLFPSGGARPDTKNQALSCSSRNSSSDRSIRVSECECWAFVSFRYVRVGNACPTIAAWALQQGERHHVGVAIRLRMSRHLCGHPLASRSASWSHCPSHLPASRGACPTRNLGAANTRRIPWRNHDCVAATTVRNEVCRQKSTMH